MQAPRAWLQGKWLLWLLPPDSGSSHPAEPCQSQEPCESRDGWCQGEHRLLSCGSLPRRAAHPCPAQPPLCPLGAGCWGALGRRGDGRSRGSLAPRLLAGTSSRPDARRGSRLPQEQFRRCFNVSQNTGNKRTLMGSKLSCAPWRIPGCLCSCQINSPVTAVMFNIPSHYLTGIPGLLQGLQPGPGHIFPPPVLVPLAGLQQHLRAFLKCSLIQGLGEEATS